MACVGIAASNDSGENAGISIIGELESNAQRTGGKVNDAHTHATCRLRSMLELQDGINSKINQDWRAANNPWYRAIWTECAELMDHIGWKWWKHQKPDLPQVHLELVDIFHFGLSNLLQTTGSPQDASVASWGAYETYAAGVLDQGSDRDQLALVESFASGVLNERSFDLAAFARLALAFGLDEIQLYERYVGKNVLNAFRQDHGYKDGTYQKLWKGREDNEWLSEIASAMPKGDLDFPQELYRRLSEKYREVIVG